MYHQSNMQMPMDKSITVPRAFRDNIVRQLQDEMTRCGGIGKSPVEVEQYIYDTIHSKEEYIEKIGKMLLALQQKQQQQQHPQQPQMAPGQGQFVRQPFPQQVQQGQYVSYQHQGQQGATVHVHSGQGQVGPGGQIIRQPHMQSSVVRQVVPDHMLQQQQQQYRANAPRPNMAPNQQPPQQILSHGQMMVQQPRQFGPGQPVIIGQPPQQPNIVMGPTVMGGKVQQQVATVQQQTQQRRSQPQQVRVEAPQPPQQQLLHSQQQQYLQAQQGQFQQQQPVPSQMMASQNFPPGVATQPAQHIMGSMPPQQQQYVNMQMQQQGPQGQSGLPRQSRSFNHGIASPNVAIPQPPTGPSPIGPKGPGSVGPANNALSPGMVPGMQGHPGMPPVPPPVTVAPHMPDQQAHQQDQGKQSVVPPNVTAQNRDQATPEEIAEKLRQLAKYKEPLKNLIETYEGHKDNSNTMTKMKRILDIISGQGCDSMALLRRCEEACQQVVARYCPEPSVNQLFSNALTKVAQASENIASQQPHVAKSALEAFAVIANKSFGSISIDSNNIDAEDLGEEWNSKLLSNSRAVPGDKVVGEIAPIFKNVAHLSRAAQRELLVLSEKYAITSRPTAAKGLNAVPNEGSAELDDLVAVDFTPTMRCLIDAGAPSICMLISPDYPESPDVPQVIFSPASELNNRLAAIKRKFSVMYESVKVASVSEVNIIRLITFYEASVLSD